MADRRTLPFWTQIDDRVTRDAVKELNKRLIGLATQIENLANQAVQATGTIGAKGQRITKVGSARDPEDAVNLSTLRSYVATALRIQSTPTALGGGGAGEGEGGEQHGEPPTVPFPNDLDVLNAFANANPGLLANSCIPSGGTWDFMDGAVAYLRANGTDGHRYGWNGKRGNCDDPSHDAISYYHGIDPPIDCSPNVYVIDIIIRFCEAPTPGWINQTGVGGAGAAWKATRP